MDTLRQSETLRYGDKRSQADTGDLPRRDEVTRRYLSQLLPEVGGPLLGLQYSDGLRLARAAGGDLDIVCVDGDGDLISHARQQKEAERISFIHADPLAYEPPWRFGLVLMSHHRLQYLLDETRLQGCLERVSDWLNDQGVFVFDLRLPTPEQLHPIEEEVELARYLDEGCHEVVEYATRYYDSISQCQTWHKRILRKGEEEHQQVRLRYTSQEQLESLLYEAGLEVQARFRDWELNPFREGDSHIVYRVGKIHR
ncbi:class I SAM-dependent methyltransferase [Pokkaliibacter sp. CJK22405]|uniref:class I SAM-dependent methyltransferase n=1 Tax=Pokkaliibacter sp. CJK22405 TaxID=3384615 RepID=UPI0039847D47